MGSYSLSTAEKMFAAVGVLACLVVASSASVVGRTKDEGVTCPQNRNDYLLPNPADCGSFYSCSNYTPYLMQCPTGLHFNPTLLVCDWPANAGCNADNSEEGSSSSSSESGSSSSSSSSSGEGSEEEEEDKINLSMLKK